MPEGPLRIVLRVVRASSRWGYTSMVFVACGHTLWFKEPPASDKVPCRKCLDDLQEPVERKVVAVKEHVRNRKQHCAVVLDCGHIRWSKYAPDIGSLWYCRDCRIKETRRQGQLRRQARERELRTKLGKNNA